jgi:hypothetical protein
MSVKHSRLLRAAPLLAGLLAFPVALSLGGCAGYHVGPVKPSKMKEVHTLAVPAFKNMTLEPKVEVMLANTLIKQLQQDGTYKIRSESDSDAVVLGTVERIERTPARGVQQDFFQTSEYTLSLVLSIKVVERTTGNTLSSREIRGNSSFFVSSSNSLSADINARVANINRDERQAIPVAAEDAAIKLTSYLSEGW